MHIWLTAAGPLLLQRHVRNSKFELHVDEADFIEENPRYTYIRFPGGREGIVSLKHLAPQRNPRPECQYEIETQNAGKEAASHEPPPLPTEVEKKEITQNRGQLRG